MNFLPTPSPCKPSVADSLGELSLRGLMLYSLCCSKPTLCLAGPDFICSWTPEWIDTEACYEGVWINQNDWLFKSLFRGFMTSHDEVSFFVVLCLHVLHLLCWPECDGAILCVYMCVWDVSWVQTWQGGEGIVCAEPWKNMPWQRDTHHTHTLTQSICQHLGCKWM